MLSTAQINEIHWLWSIDDLTFNRHFALLATKADKDRFFQTVIHEFRMRKMVIPDSENLSDQDEPEIYQRVHELLTETCFKEHMQRFAQSLPMLNLSEMKSAAANTPAPDVELEPLHEAEASILLAETLMRSKVDLPFPVTSMSVYLVKNQVLFADFLSSALADRTLEKHMDKRK